MNPEQQAACVAFLARDGKIAGPGRKTVRISGDASMEMTHRLRAMHDAIVIGIGTLLNDDPQLNARLAPEPAHNPRPVVLDDALRMPLDCRLLKNAADGSGRTPLILAMYPVNAADVAEWNRRREVLTHAGAEVAIVESETEGILTWDAIRTRLQQFHLFSIMVEGGATVIDSLLTAHATNPPKVQAAIVTISPNPLGTDAYGYKTSLPLDGGEASALQYAETLELDGDRVVALRG